MDHLLSKHPQIFIEAPAKAGGTSLNEFAKACAQSTLDNLDQKQKVMETFHVPSIISEHMGTVSHKGVLNLIEQASTSSLILYSHRLEVSRLKSAILEVIGIRLVHPSPEQPELVAWSSIYQNKHHFKVTSNETHSFIPEAAVVLLVKEKATEIGFMDTDILTCDVFHSIRTNAPNLIFMNYEQSNTIQALLSKYHCPGGLTSVKMNQSKGSKRHGMDIVVKLSGSKKEYLIHDWIDMKINVLQWALNMKSNTQCQGKIRAMEEELFSCPSELIQVQNLNVI